MMGELDCLFFKAKYSIDPVNDVHQSMTQIFLSPVPIFLLGFTNKYCTCSKSLDIHLVYFEQLRRNEAS